MGQLVNNRVLKLPIYRWRCTTIPAPWGLLTIGALILVLGDALYRVLFVPTVSHTILLTPGECLVLRLFGGLLVTGWWALLLAELGKFFSWLVILGPLGLSMTLYVIAWHLGRLREVRTASPWQYTPAGLTLVGIVTLATYLFFARPFETIVGAEDAGVYFSSGGAIAREHGILLTDPGLATFGDAAADAQAKGAARHLLLPLDPTRYRFATWLRLSGFFLDQQQSDVVTPQFFHLFPTWLAVWALLGGGIGAMVYGAPAFGLLGVVLIFFLGRRLFGSAVGALSSLFLSLNGLQLWFARQSLSEVLLQVLLLGAAYTWVLFVEAHRAQDTRRARGALVLAGMALGSVALTHAQFVFLALPLAILIARLWLGRQWSRVYLWFAVPLFLLLVQAAVHIQRYSLGYFEGVYHHVWLNAWRDWQQTIVLVLSPIALLGILDRTRHHWLPRLHAHRTRLLVRRLAVLFISVGAAYLYLVWPGIFGSSTVEGYIGAPIPQGAAAGIVSLGWYFSPLGVALAVLGLALVVLDDPDERIWAVLCLALPFAVLYLLTGTYTAGGYIYRLRRFVPLIVPLTTLLIAFAIVRGGPLVANLLQRPRLTSPLRVLGIVISGILVIFFLFTNAPIAVHREYAGVLAQVASIDASFGPDDLLLFSSGERDLAMKLSTPLQYLFGRESWAVTTNIPDGPILDAWIAAREHDGKHVYVFMTANGGKLFLPRHRFVPTGAVDLTLAQFEMLQDQKPHNRQVNTLRYTIYRLDPVAPGSALGSLPYRVVAGQADEVAEVAGFYDWELAPTPQGSLPARWTNGEALLRIPWPDPGLPMTLRLTVSGGKRPAAMGSAQVSVGLRSSAGATDMEQPLTTLTLTENFAEYTIPIPPGSLAPTADGTAVIHLAMLTQSPMQERQSGGAWVPANYPSEFGTTGDQRVLHIRFYSAELVATQDARR